MSCETELFDAARQYRSSSSKKHVLFVTHSNDTT